MTLKKADPGPCPTGHSRAVLCFPEDVKRGWLSLNWRLSPDTSVINNGQFVPFRRRPYQNRWFLRGPSLLRSVRCGKCRDLPPTPPSLDTHNFATCGWTLMLPVLPCRQNVQKHGVTKQNPPLPCTVLPDKTQTAHTAKECVGWEVQSVGRKP